MARQPFKRVLKSMTRVHEKQGFTGILKGFLFPWIYLMGAAVLSALIAYPLFRGFGHGDISFFRTLVSRGGQVLLLLGLIPMARRLTMKANDFGLIPGIASGVARGFLLGIITLSLHSLLLVYLGVRTIKAVNMDVLGMESVFLSALLSGVGVALLEETLFRGALIGILLRLTGPMSAIVISAVDYAALHFIGSHWTTEPANVGWDTGFRIALDGFSHLPNADPASLLALFVAGLLLGSVRLFFRGGIATSIGLHAGWVFVIKIFKPFTVINFTSKKLWMIGVYDQVIGYGSCIWVLILLIAVLYPQMKSRRT